MNKYDKFLKKALDKMFTYVGFTSFDEQFTKENQDWYDKKEWSENTCEITGEMGVLCHRGGWFKTLCYEEARKLEYKAWNESIEKYWKQKDKKPLYAYKHKPTNTWVYFLPNRNVIGLSLKADATTFSNSDELKFKLTTCSFNGVENYCKDNLLEFEMVELTEYKNE